MPVSIYSCVNCGGPVRFDIAAKRFKCKQCHTAYTLEQMNEAFPDDEQGSLWGKAKEGTKAEKILEKADVLNAEDKETVVKVYHCPLCDANIMADSETLAAALCAFCRTPVTISEKLLSGHSMPSRLIPFSVTRDEAFDIYQSKVNGNPLLPEAFKGKVLRTDLKAVYIPFRLYDAECSASITAKCENVSTWSDNDYEYTKTDTYEARRHGTMGFVQTPVNESCKMNDDRMEEIEPFEIKELTPFSAKYLSGHFAEAPTTKESDLEATLFRRLKPAAVQTLFNTISGYSRVSLSSSQVSIDKAESEYVMLPAWMFYTTFKGEEYIFAINGQTGLFAGKLPVDWGRVCSIFMQLAVAIFTVVFIALEVYLWMS